jgi:hypothetical protein
MKWTSRLAILVAIFIGILPSHTYAFKYTNEEKPLHITLKVKKAVIKYGEFPTLELFVANASNKKIKILDLRNRPDLQDNYGKVVFFRDGRRFQFRTAAISDPGPIGEGDFIELSPNENVHIILSDPPYNPKELRPGKYEVNFVYHSNPIEGTYSNYYQTNKVEFVVDK